MKDKKPLAVGDRVAAYTSMGRRTGRVYSLEDALVMVDLDTPFRGRNVFAVHPKQCRRLRPRPAKEERERLRATIKLEIRHDSHEGKSRHLQYNYEFRDIQQCQAELITPLEGNGPLVCLKPGEVLVDRAKLRTAFSIAGKIQREEKVCFQTAVATALGLKGPQ